MASDQAATLDAIGLEVLWNRLISVCNEQAAALIRTSFSTVVRESEDLSAGVFDARGNMVAQSVTGTPGHINSMATSMHHFRNVFPTEELEPGDILITNDPWFTSGQLNDLTIVTPVFLGEQVVAFFGNTCHAADIGGRGLAADARDVYEEGLYIPIMKLYERGEPNRDLFAMIEGNVRTPDVILGDIHAQVACNDVGGRRLLEFMGDFDLETIEGVSDQILDRSEAAMRDAFRAMPDGVYENETFSDGFLEDDPIRLACAIEVDGDSIIVDFDGTSPESKLGINVVLNYTLAYTTFCFKAAINPEVPNNEGSFRPVGVRAPAGCILNAQRPAPVAGRHILGHLVPNLLFGALAKIVPDRVTAEGAAGIWISQMRGFDERGQFTFAIFSCGGTGARTQQGRSRQYRVSQRRGGYPGRGDRVGLAARAPRASGTAGLRRARHVPRRRRPDDARRNPLGERLDRVVAGRSCSVSAAWVPRRLGRSERRLLAVRWQPRRPEAPAAAAAGHGDLPLATRGRRLRLAAGARCGRRAR